MNRSPRGLSIPPETLPIGKKRQNEKSGVPIEKTNDEMRLGGSPHRKKKRGGEEGS